MRVVFCGGGTGGHVYPALTVAAALRRLQPDAEISYVGVAGKIDEELVRREGVRFRAVTAGPLRVGTLAGGVKGFLMLLAGTAEALTILQRFRPDVVFATGGYGSAGVGLAAWLLRRPLIVLLPDVEAGLAVRLLARLARQVAVTVPPALAAMPSDKTALAGYPVRPAFFEAKREEGRQRLGLDAKLPVVLVSGASSGANALNRAVAARALSFVESAQLLHLSGRADEAWLRSEREQLPQELRQRWQIHAYLHEEMPYALAAADLAVMRAGASVLGELAAARLPAVLVPGVYEGHDQTPNARYLEEAGAAVLLPQTRLSDLAAVVLSLLGDKGNLEAMREALARLARPEAAEELAKLVLAAAGVAAPPMEAVQP